MARPFWDLRVSIGNSNPSHRARVTAQEEEGDITSGGHQVDEHGHPNGPEGRQAEFLHQETAQEDAQTGTWDRSHPWRRAEGQGPLAREEGPINADPGCQARGRALHGQDSL